MKIKYNSIKIILSVFLGLFVIVLLSFSIVLTKRWLKKEKPVTKVSTEVQPKLTVDDIFRNDTTYYLIAGSFLNEENAIKRQNELISQGFNNAKIIKEDTVNYYRLCVKVLDNEKMARFYLDAIKTLYDEYFDAWLIIIGEEKN